MKTLIFSFRLFGY